MLYFSVVKEVKTITELLYRHSRDIFIGNKFKSFVYKYFKDVRFKGCEYGNNFPTITISNWDEIKDTLPTSYQPIETKNI